MLAFRNPQRIRGVLGHGIALADLHLPIRVGADMALFQWLNRRLVHDDAALDRTFVEGWCDGLDELRAHLDGLDPAALLAATGLDEDAVADLYTRVASSERIVICWAMGLTQHRQAVATIQELTNTLLLRGAIGKPGAGVCPVRGHSNVQGDRTMGIFEKPPPALLDALEARFGFHPPRDDGFDTVAALTAMARCDVDVFVGLGGNLVSAAPDTDVAAAAMERCALTVQVSTKLNRSHVRCGREAIILPCLGRTERDERAGQRRFVTVEDSMGIVHATRGVNAPASAHLRSEVDIVCGIARAALGDGGIDWAELSADYDMIREHIAAVIPGFEDFNARVRAAGRVCAPERPPRQPRVQHRHRPRPSQCQPLRAGRRAAGTTAPPDGALARPVQHHDLRVGRPLPRHRARPARGVRERRRPRCARPPRR